MNISVDKVVKSTAMRLRVISEASQKLRYADFDEAREAYLIIARNVNDIIGTLRKFRNQCWKVLKMKEPR